jgi:hypothetical protein
MLDAAECNQNGVLDRGKAPLARGFVLTVCSQFAIERTEWPPSGRLHGIAPYQ